MNQPRLPFLVYRALYRLRSLFYESLDRLGILALRLLRETGLKKAAPPVRLESIRNVLIIRTDAIGDIILTTPLVKAAKACLPRANLTFLVAEESRELVEGVPGCDRIIGHRRGRGPARLLSFLNTARILRRERYDLVLALPHGSLGVAVWALVSGAAYRVGYRSRGFGWLFSHGLPDERGYRIKHEVENCLELLRALGLRPDESVKSLYLKVDAEAKERMVGYLDVMGISLENEGIALIHPGSRTTWVRWLPERFAQVADQMQAKWGVRIILVGGPGEESISGSVARCMKSPALDLTGRLSLVELAALASVSRLFIGHSTGPMHLAAAANIPVVALFGPASPTDHCERWRPYGPKGVVIFKDVCPEKCIPKYCANLECMAAIQVEDVLERVESILASKKVGFINRGAGL